MSTTIETTLRGSEIEFEFYVSPDQRGGRETEHLDDEIEIIAVTANGVDITASLMRDERRRLRLAAEQHLDNLRDQREIENHIEQTEYRYDDR